ncbi:MAG: hypothetical protein LiPW15_79 [Parcubacteria group bacterium LiPW_15]|nr:MAG: hypothetical protein LiPW15_79 [Parcubacteria group bacterium LiPW_15]
MADFLLVDLDRGVVVDLLLPANDIEAAKRMAREKYGVLPSHFHLAQLVPDDSPSSFDFTSASQS